MKIDLMDLAVDVFVWGGIAVAGYASWRGLGFPGLAIPAAMLWATGLIATALQSLSGAPDGGFYVPRHQQNQSQPGRG